MVLDPLGKLLMKRSGRLLQQSVGLEAMEHWARLEAWVQRALRMEQYLQRRSRMRLGCMGMQLR